MEVSGQLHAPAALPTVKETLWYPLHSRLGGPHSRPGRSMCYGNKVHINLLSSFRRET
jgi:hypothetical protein